MSFPKNDNYYDWDYQMSGLETYDTKWLENFRDRNSITNMAVEELSFHLLKSMKDDEYLNRLMINGNNGEGYYLYKIVHSASVHFNSFNNDKNEYLVQAICEAWFWLENNGFLIPQNPLYNGNELGSVVKHKSRILSRYAKEIELDSDVVKLVILKKYPRDLFHSRLRHDVWSSFIQGKFASAVSESMIAVEVAVRDAAVEKDDLHGAKLFRKAFEPEEGWLSDPNRIKGDKGGPDQDYANLFASCFSVFRNPVAHGRANYNSADEAFGVLMIANQLLKIVDEAKMRQNRDS